MVQRGSGFLGKIIQLMKYRETILLKPVTSLLLAQPLYIYIRYSTITHPDTGGCDIVQHIAPDLIPVPAVNVEVANTYVEEGRGAEVKGRETEP